MKWPRKSRTPEPSLVAPAPRSASESFIVNSNRDAWTYDYDKLLADGNDPDKVAELLRADLDVYENDQKLAAIDRQMGMTAGQDVVTAASRARPA